jgi:hypothetical protein
MIIITKKTIFFGDMIVYNIISFHSVCKGNNIAA